MRKSSFSRSFLNNRRAHLRTVQMTISNLYSCTILVMRFWRKGETILACFRGIFKKKKKCERARREKMVACGWSTIRDTRRKNSLLYNRNVKKKQIVSHRIDSKESSTWKMREEKKKNNFLSQRERYWG